MSVFVKRTLIIDVTTYHFLTVEIKAFKFGFIDFCDFFSFLFVRHG